MTGIAEQPVKSNRRLPPGPRGQFLLGNSVEFARDWMGFLTRCVRDYGDTVYIRLFNAPTCLLIHPDAIESVLLTHASNFTKSKDYRALAGVMGKGLLTSEGDLWRQQRKLIQTAFHHDAVISYVRIMSDCAEEMLETWRDGETRDVHEDMMSLTIRIVARALFGADVSRSTDEIGRAMQVVVRQMVGQINLAFLLPETWPLPRTLRLRRAVQQLDKIIYAIIEQRRRDPSAPDDLLSHLMRAQDEGMPAMSDAQLRDEVMTLLLAGHETTAIALSWAWYLLALHPAVEAKLAEEAQEVLGGRVATPQDLPRLRFSGMVVKETLRLYPPVWGIGRQARSDFEINGYRLPAGTHVFVLQWVTQRDARFFPEPLQFRPERWEDNVVGRTDLPRFAYFPFGGGPRTCVGSSFALNEATLVLATIAQRFRLTLVPGHPVEVFPSITLRPKHGIKVMLHRRS